MLLYFKQAEEMKKVTEETIPKFVGIFEKLLKENGSKGQFIGSAVSCEFNFIFLSFKKKVFLRLLVTFAVRFHSEKHSICTISTFKLAQNLYDISSILPNKNVINLEIVTMLKFHTIFYAEDSGLLNANVF